MNPARTIVYFLSAFSIAVAGPALSHVDADVAAHDRAGTHLVKEVMPAVYHVEATFRLTGKDSGTRDGNGTGTAFGVTSDGLVLTNAHIIRRYFSDLPEPVYTPPAKFTYSDGDVLEGVYTLVAHNGTRYNAEIVALDPKNDLAILSIAKAAPGKSFPVLTFGEEAPEYFDSVVAIGGPFNHPFTISRGIVTHPGRTMDWGTLVQTDAVVHPGNSGGPLVRIRDHMVIGMMVEVFTPPLWVQLGPAGALPVQARFGVGLGFAIPAHVMKKFLDETLKGLREKP